jgi:hypothetical protein
MKKEAFQSFLGVNRGEGVERVTTLFGNPDEEYNNSENHYIIYYYRFGDSDVLSISFGKETMVVETIYFGHRRIQNTFDWLESVGIDDPKAYLLDKHIDEIIDLLGVPDEEEPDDFFYRTDNMEVNFYCPEENDFFCRRIMVSWFA